MSTILPISEREDIRRCQNRLDDANVTLTGLNEQLAEALQAVLERQTVLDAIIKDKGEPTGSLQELREAEQRAAALEAHVKRAQHTATLIDAELYVKQMDVMREETNTVLASTRQTIREIDAAIADSSAAMARWLKSMARARQYDHLEPKKEP